MGFYLQIVSPTGERKEGKFIFKLAQAGAYLESVYGTRSKFIVRLDEEGAELVPLHPKSDVATDHHLSELSMFSLTDIPEYPVVDWWGDFVLGIAAIEISPFTEDKKDRGHIASVRLSWATEGRAYLTFLGAMLEICDAVGLQIVDGQGNFGVITQANLDAAVQNLTRSSSVICDLLGVVGDGKTEAGPEDAETEDAEAGAVEEVIDMTDPEVQGKLDLNVADLHLSVRAANCLKSGGIATVGDLVKHTDEELLEIRNFGETTLSEVEQKLAELGLRLKPQKKVVVRDNKTEADAEAVETWSEDALEERDGMSDNEENERRIASEVLGAIREPQVTGNHVPDYESMSEPLVQEEAVIRAGCVGCGYCLELTESGAQRLAKLAGVEKPASWEGYYFEAQRCRLCDRDYRGVDLKRTSDLRA